MSSTKKSIFFIIGNISDKTSRYQVQDVKLNNGVEFAVYLDGLGIKIKTDKPFDEARDFVKSILDIIVSGVVFLKQIPITYGFQSWVEAKAVEIEKALIGWFFAPASQHMSVRTQRSPINTPWKKAAYLF